MPTGPLPTLSRLRPRPILAAAAAAAAARRRKRGSWRLLQQHGVRRIGEEWRASYCRRERGGKKYLRFGICINIPAVLQYSCKVGRKKCGGGEGGGGEKGERGEEISEMSGKGKRPKRALNFHICVAVAVASSSSFSRPREGSFFPFPRLLFNLWKRRRRFDV